MDTRVDARAKRSGGVAMLALLVAAATPVVGANRETVETLSVGVEPNVRWGVMPDVGLKIRTGFAVAVGRAREIPECAALFSEFGADPVELLGRALYYPAALNRNNLACRNGAQAFTPVGSPITWVCDRFARLDTDKAALVLLHEALHFAGLTEQPHDPRAMTSSEINDMVKDRCGH
jgi:hypothetical protein